jgi:hypothetical protein
MRPKHVVAYETTFGKTPPETADAWDIRCAVFYEQKLRILKIEDQKPDAKFLQCHKTVLRFGTRDQKMQKKAETPDVGGVSTRNLQLIFHTCGHKVTRAVTLEELKFAEQQLPCHKCAPRAAIQHSNCMGLHVANHPNAQKEAGMSKKGSKKTKNEEPIGKGLKGQTSGLNKRAFYIQTLKTNEEAGPRSKKNDEELQQVFDAEFPNTPSYSVKSIRASLNRGVFGDHGFVSKAYGAVAETPAKPGRKVAPAAPPPAPEPVAAPAKRGRKPNAPPAPEPVAAPVVKAKTTRLRVPVATA